jgi:CheY-like chemotaxis protein
MTRPCFLVIDREFAGSISTRKLVIETAKYNVVTAYSALEAVETLERFPKMDGAVIDSGVNDILCNDLVIRLRAIRPDLPIIALAAPGVEDCTNADHLLESFAPDKLLVLLKKIVPDQCKEIEKHEIALHEEEK